jgi:hypothetical protein
MSDGIPIGPAYAWKDESGQWLFSPFKAMAPPNAVEVERAAVDGRTVLYWNRGGTDGSLYIWDARQAD